MVDRLFPVDKEIINAYNNLTNWSEIKTTSFDEALSSGKIEWVKDEIVEITTKLLKQKLFKIKMCLENGSKLSIVYTNLHGTGEVYCQATAKRLGYKLLLNT